MLTESDWRRPKNLNRTNGTAAGPDMQVAKDAPGAFGIGLICADASSALIPLSVNSSEILKKRNPDSGDIHNLRVCPAEETLSPPLVSGCADLSGNMKEIEGA